MRRPPIKSPGKPRAAGLVESVWKLEAVRVKRDELWAQAAKAEGPAKAELLRQGLDAMGNANWGRQRELLCGNPQTDPRGRPKG